jgi:hypothetical protein
MLLLSLVLIAFLAGSTAAQSPLRSDLNKDYRVDFEDMWILALQWLNPDCLVLDCIADLDDANGVNMADFALLAANWHQVRSHLVINELMSSTASVPPLEEWELLDGNGESSDWIEFYNPTDTVVNLDGWYMTDDDANLIKWQFPNGLEIQPGEFLIVFAIRSMSYTHIIIRILIPLITITPTSISTRVESIWHWWDLMASPSSTNTLRSSLTS